MDIESPELSFGVNKGIREPNERQGTYIVYTKTTGRLEMLYLVPKVLSDPGILFFMLSRG
jgi:hypothetical protein